jgi:hypothetical protein
MKSIRNESDILIWLEQFTSLKEIIQKIKIKWKYQEPQEDQMNKQILIKNFCLKLGDIDDILENEKKKIFKIIQFSIKVVKSMKQTKVKENNGNEFLNLLI